MEKNDDYAAKLKVKLGGSRENRGKKSNSLILLRMSFSAIQHVQRHNVCYLIEKVTIMVILFVVIYNLF